jgi:hypothetical protein
MIENKLPRVPWMDRNTDSMLDATEKLYGGVGRGYEEPPSVALFDRIRDMA